MGYELDRLMAQYGATTPVTLPAGAANVPMYSAAQFQPLKPTVPAVVTFSQLQREAMAPGAGGQAEANRRVMEWLTNNPNATPEQIQAAMREFGVTEFDVMNARNSLAGWGGMPSSVFDRTISALPAPATRAPAPATKAPTPVTPAPAQPPAAQPLYQSLTASSTPEQIAQAYRQFVAERGGDSEANRAEALSFLLARGISQPVINTAYDLFKASEVSKMGASAGARTIAAAGDGSADVMASPHASLGAPANKALFSQQPSFTRLSRNSSPSEISAAYDDFIASRGGDTEANRAEALQFLQSKGIGQSKINEAYSKFQKGETVAEVTGVPQEDWEKNATFAIRPTPYEKPVAVWRDPTTGKGVAVSKLTSTGLPSGLRFLDEQGNYLTGSTFTAESFYEAADKAGIDLSNVWQLGDLLDEKGVKYKPYELYAGTGSDHGINFYDIAQGGLGSAYDWTKDSLVHLKGESGAKSLANAQALAQRLGVQKNPFVTTEMGIDPSAFRTITEGKTPGQGPLRQNVAFTGGTASWYRTPEEAQRYLTGVGGGDLYKTSFGAAPERVSGTRGPQPVTSPVGSLDLASSTGIANAYNQYLASQQSGDTEASRAQAQQFLQSQGVQQPLINQAYNVYKEGLTNPQGIASAYNEFISSRGGDTEANRAEALQYLQNQGIAQPMINQAYDVFKQKAFARGGAVEVKHFQTGGLNEADQREDFAGLAERYGAQLPAEPTPLGAAQPLVSPAAEQPVSLDAMLAKYLQPTASGMNYGQELAAARKTAQAETEAFQRLLQQAIAQPDQPPSKSELYFRLAAAFADPGKTGSFGEGLGKAAGAVAEQKKAEREAARASAAQKLQLGLTAQQARMQAAKEDVGTLRGLAAEDEKSRRAVASELLKEWVKKNDPVSTAGKQAQDEGLRPGTPEFQRRVKEISELNIEKQMATINAAVAQMSVAAGTLSLRQQAEARAQEASKKLTPAEVKLKTETEDTLAAADSAIGMLERAYALNPNTFDTSLPDLAQRKVLEAAGSKDKKLLNTRELENLLGEQALAKLKATFGGAPTEGERQALLDLQGLGAKSIQERAQIMKNIFRVLRDNRARQRKRLNDINAGLYRDVSGQQPSPLE